MFVFSLSMLLSLGELAPARFLEDGRPQGIGLSLNSSKISKPFSVHQGHMGEPS